MSNIYAFSKITIKKSIEYNLCSLEMREYSVNYKEEKICVK